MPDDGGGPWTRRDAALATALAGASAVPRALLRGRGVHDIDSMLLALGVRSFDFAAYHPHPPYHPLTIAAAKLLAPFVGPAGALTWVSIVSAAVLAVAVYGIGRALGGRLVGAYAALVLALSPLATANTGIALSYANEPAALAVVALLAIRARARRDVSSWVLLGIAASVAVGVRPSAAITAGPLMLWAIGRDLRAFLRSATSGAVATAVWLGAAVAAGGGWADFRYGTRFQTRYYVLHDPAWVGGWGAVSNNLAWLAHHLRAEVAWLAAVVGLALCAGLVLWVDRGARHRGVLLVWGAPTLLFYGLVYGGWPLFHSGYALGALPPAAIAGALALRRVHEGVVARLGDPAVRMAGLRRAATAVVAVVAVLPATWVGAWPDALAERREAEAWAASWSGLEDALPPQRTALLGGYAIHWALLEHPGYLTYVVEAAVDPDGVTRLQVQEVGRDGRFDKAYFDNVRDGPDDARHVIPDWVVEVAVVEPHPFDVPGSLVGVPAARVVVLPGGAVVKVLDARSLPDIESAVAGYGLAFAPSQERHWPPAAH